MELTLVTGNPNKLEEFKKILTGIELRNEKIDLDEIQSTSLEEICKHKAIQAYKILKKPIIIEDTGLFLDELCGLPGPFIKFFNEKLGKKSMIKLLGNSKNRKAVARTCIAYYDGKDLILSMGEVEGDITEEPKEGEGFGFDFSFIPKGYDKTFSELGLQTKNKISHRACAIKQFSNNMKKLFNN